jgi:GABA(A) receptor-associated protein
MSYKSEFKENYKFEDRLQESNRIIEKYPDRRPIICEKSTSPYNLPILDKKKYLAPYDLTVGQFIFIIRRRMKLNPDEAIFIFVNGLIIPTSAMVGNVYDYYKDPDGFLYIQYSKENTFG